MRMTRRISVVGIDGCGKSTVLDRFLELVRGADVAGLTCPQYHRTPDAPLARLSERLDEFSRAADSLGSFELKATALFLQMTLYGPVERFALETFRPAFLLSERHALVDSLAYGPFYVQMVRQNPDRARFEPALRGRLAWDDIVRWQSLRSERSIWDLALEVRDLFRLPFRETVRALGREYGTTLPDVLLLLDVDVPTALERLSRRAEAELHENGAVLEQLRRSYLGTIEALRREHPEVEVHVVRGGAGVDETLHEVLARSGMTAAMR